MDIFDVVDGTDASGEYLVPDTGGYSLRVLASFAGWTAEIVTPDNYVDSVLTSKMTEKFYSHPTNATTLHAIGRWIQQTVGREEWILTNTSATPTYNHNRGDSPATPCALCVERAHVVVLKAALEAARVGHYFCEDGWYSCPLADGGCSDDTVRKECNCDAERHNAAIDAALGAKP